MKYPCKMFSTGPATSASNYQWHYINMPLSLLSDIFIFSIIILPFSAFSPLSNFFFDIPFSLCCHVLVKQFYIIILVITVEITTYTLGFLQFIICVYMCCACVCIHVLMCVCMHPESELTTSMHSREPACSGHPVSTFCVLGVPATLPAYESWGCDRWCTCTHSVIFVQ